MANLIKISRLNPVQYRQMNFTQAQQYLSKHMDSFRYFETIQPWQQPAQYFQTWQTNDSTREQIISEYGPITKQVYDCEGNKIGAPIPFTQLQQNRYQPGTYIYQQDLALSFLQPDRVYFYVLSFGLLANEFLVSEPQYIKTEHSGSLLFEYSHEGYNKGWIFTQQFVPNLRLVSSIKYQAPGSRDTIYEDQPANVVMLDSTTYRVWSLKLGSKTGLPMGHPPYIIDKMNDIFSCEFVRADGRYYTKSPESSWEEVAIDRYPLSMWTHDLRSRYNRDTDIYENDQQIVGRVALVANVDSKGFGQQQGGDITQIINVE